MSNAPSRPQPMTPTRRCETPPLLLSNIFNSRHLFLQTENWELHGSNFWHILWETCRKSERIYSPHWNPRKEATRNPYRASFRTAAKYAALAQVDKTNAWVRFLNSKRFCKSSPRATSNCRDGKSRVIFPCAMFPRTLQVCSATRVKRKRTNWSIAFVWEELSPCKISGLLDLSAGENHSEKAEEASYLRTVHFIVSNSLSTYSSSAFHVCLWKTGPPKRKFPPRNVGDNINGQLSPQWNQHLFQKVPLFCRCGVFSQGFPLHTSSGTTGCLIHTSRVVWKMFWKTPLKCVEM